jgi:hypothetical protein
MKKHESKAPAVVAMPEIGETEAPVNEKVCPVCNPKQIVLRMREGASWVEFGCPGCHLMWLEPRVTYADLAMRKR